MVERISTGLKKLDELLQGGIPKFFSVAVAGEPGTGKTILSMHFINKGLENDEPAIYVTTEESRESILTQAKQFNFIFQEKLEEGKLIIIDALMKEYQDQWSLRKIEIDELLRKIVEAKKLFGYTHARLVIDSMSAFWLDKPAMARKYSYRVKSFLNKWKFTYYMTSQYAITTSEAFGFGIEHVADGIIRLRKRIVGGTLKRYLIIEKMRQTAHDLRVWEITVENGKGIIFIKPAKYTRGDFALPEEVMRKIKESKQENNFEKDIR
ncbi:MAG: KaiC domain-containing protein [Candidatus Njordarchaeia archaeon]